VAEQNLEILKNTLEAISFLQMYAGFVRYKTKWYKPIDTKLRGIKTPLRYTDKKMTHHLFETFRKQL
jgi:hypothetical protein